MADIIDCIREVIRTVILMAFILALAVGVTLSAVAFIADQKRDRKHPDQETGWRPVQEGRLCDCTTNGIYRIQIKEN